MIRNEKKRMVLHCQFSFSIKNINPKPPAVTSETFGLRTIHDRYSSTRVAQSKAAGVEQGTTAG